MFMSPNMSNSALILPDCPRPVSPFARLRLRPSGACCIASRATPRPVLALTDSLLYGRLHPASPRRSPLPTRPWPCYDSPTPWPRGGASPPASQRGGRGHRTHAGRDVLPSPPLLQRRRRCRQQYWSCRRRSVARRGRCRGRIARIPTARHPHGRGRSRSRRRSACGERCTASRAIGGSGRARDGCHRNLPAALGHISATSQACAAWRVVSPPAGEGRCT